MFSFYVYFFRNFIETQEKTELHTKAKICFLCPSPSSKLWFLNFLQIFPSRLLFPMSIEEFYWIFIGFDLLFLCVNPLNEAFSAVESFICFLQHCLCRIRTKRIILNMYFLLLYLYLFWFFDIVREHSLWTSPFFFSAVN